MCFLNPAVVNARGIFLCQDCLHHYAEQQKPKHLCGQCEEPKGKNHACKPKLVEVSDVMSKLKWM